MNFSGIVSLSSPASKYVDQFFHTVRSYSTTFVLILIFPATLVAYGDYKAWYALGAGGGPHNILGWSIQALLRPFCSRDVRSTSCYQNALLTEESANFLEDVDVPAREGPAPKTGLWTFPHRLVEDTATDMLKNSLREILNRLSTSNPTLLAFGKSTIEGGCPALFLVSPTMPKHCSFPGAPRELVHTHCTDGSSHALLSPADAKLVIERGWGERHGLSGKFGVPINYVMIFAPRSVGEVVVVERIARAAVRYGLDGKEIL
ncbi:hypothetical protein ACLMJK_008808 [Lecanora helva]